MIRRPPRSTLDRSSAASDVYKRQALHRFGNVDCAVVNGDRRVSVDGVVAGGQRQRAAADGDGIVGAVSYTHLRAHETVLDIVCRLLLEKKQLAESDLEDSP